MAGLSYLADTAAARRLRATGAFTEELRSKYTRMQSPRQPLISLAALKRAFSPERIRAYRLTSDRDETDGVARYLWNLALAAAIQPVLHALEITFRNEISRAAARLTASRGYTYERVPSWLDATPSMLLEREKEKVEHAKEHLSAHSNVLTEGRLIAKLDFGFWVALCRDPYADWRADGPRLWPRALDLAFRWRPSGVTTHSQLLHRFNAIRLFRNRLAHHEPIWDRDYLGKHEFIIQSLGWMSPKLADAAREMSTAVDVFKSGPQAFRSRAERLVGRSGESSHHSE